RRVFPLSTVVVVGVTCMEPKVAAVTVFVVEPLLPPNAAPIVALPWLRPLARPRDPSALDTVAAASFELDQVAVAVRSWVEASEYVPVAVNCRVFPLATVGLVGVTWIDTNVAAVTVIVVEPVLPPNAALIV